MDRRLLNTDKKKRYIESPSSFSAVQRAKIKYSVKNDIKNTFDDLETLLESDISGHTSIKKYILERIGKISGTPVEQNDKESQDEKEYESDDEKDFWSDLDSVSN